MLPRTSGTTAGCDVAFPLIMIICWVIPASGWCTTPAHGRPGRGAQDGTVLSSFTALQSRDRGSETTV